MSKRGRLDKDRAAPQNKCYMKPLWKFLTTNVSVHRELNQAFWPSEKSMSYLLDKEDEALVVEDSFEAF